MTITHLKDKIKNQFKFQGRVCHNGLELHRFDYYPFQYRNIDTSLQRQQTKLRFVFSL